MTAFYVLAALLTTAVLLRLLWPLWQGGRRQTVSVAQLNSKVYRDQLAELERDLARGQLDESAYQEARDELQRRLLQDVDASPASPAVSGPARWTAIALVVLVPLGAAGVYAAVGNAAAIDPPDHAVAPQNVRDAVEKLAAALEKNPDNPEGWLLLARTYRKMERFAESAAAYDRASALVSRSPDLLVEQADVLAAASNDELEGRPMALVKQALALDPRHPMSLMLMGMSAYRGGDFAGAIAQWQTLLTVLPAGSPEAQQVQANIDQAREVGKVPAAAVPPTTARAAPPAASAAAATPPAGGAATATAGRDVKGEVSLSPELAAKLGPNDVLFVIARPDDGSRAPVAVLRKRASDFPLSFVLDDSLAMMPERTLSKAKSVILVARISRSGQPMAQPGDLTSEATVPITPGTTGIRLVIDRQL